MLLLKHNIECNKAILCPWVKQGVVERKLKKTNRGRDIAEIATKNRTEYCEGNSHMLVVVTNWPSKQ